jgi:hypothetical protein
MPKVTVNGEVDLCSNQYNAETVQAGFRYDSGANGGLGNRRSDLRRCSASAMHGSPPPTFAVERGKGSANVG